jgi:hypothetical protein
MLGSVMVIAMLLETAIETAIEMETETPIALAVKGVQRHRAAELVVPMPKAPALTVTVAARAIAAAVREIAVAITVQGPRHGVMLHVVTAARSSAARGAKLF